MDGNLELRCPPPPPPFGQNSEAASFRPEVVEVLFISLCKIITGRRGWGIVCLFVPSIELIMANVLLVLWAKGGSHRWALWAECDRHSSCVFMGRGSWK